MYNDIVPNGLPLYTNQRLLNYRKPWVMPSDRDAFRNTLAYTSATDELFIPRLDAKRVTSGNAVDSFTIYALIDDYTGATSIESLSVGDWSFTDLTTGDAPTYESLFKVQGVVTLTQPLSEEVPYYFRVVSGAEIYYSEVFFVAEASASVTIPAECPDGFEWVRLYWQTGTNILSDTWHPDGSIYSINLLVTIAQPEYRFEDDTEDDGAGNKNSIFKRAVKRFRFFIVAPEYISDILNALPLFPDVNLKWADGSQMDIREIEVDNNPTTNGLSTVTFSFAAPQAYVFKGTLC